MPFHQMRTRRPREEREPARDGTAPGMPAGGRRGPHPAARQAPPDSLGLGGGGETNSLHFLLTPSTLRPPFFTVRSRQVNISCGGRRGGRHGGQKTKKPPVEFPKPRNTLLPFSAPQVTSKLSARHSPRSRREGAPSSGPAGAGQVPGQVAGGAAGPALLPQGQGHLPQRGGRRGARGGACGPLRASGMRKREPAAPAPTGGFLRGRPPPGVPASPRGPAPASRRAPQGARLAHSPAAGRQGKKKGEKRAPYSPDTWSEWARGQLKGNKGGSPVRAGRERPPVRRPRGAAPVPARRLPVRGGLPPRPGSAALPRGGCAA